MPGVMTKSTAVAFLAGGLVAASLVLLTDAVLSDRERPPRESTLPAAAAVNVPTITAPESHDAPPVEEPVTPEPRAAFPATSPAKAKSPVSTPAPPERMERAKPAVPVTQPAPAARPAEPEIPVISVLGQAAEAVTAAPSHNAPDPPSKTDSHPGILRPDAMEVKRAKESRTAETVTIPAGTVLNVRMNQGLSTDRHVSGDTFSGTLDQPLVIDGMVIAERGARVDGQVLTADKGGRAAGRAFLTVRLVTLHTSDHQRVAILTDEFRREGESSVRSDATKVAIGAGVGAALGAIFGGGKGAAIGAGVGGASGAGTVLLTRGKPAQIESEARVPFRLREPVTITEKID